MMKHVIEAMDRHRFVLAFLVLLVAGGGCMSAPFVPQSPTDLRQLGVGESTRARLAGMADPAPDGPEPTAGLSGKLMIAEISPYPYDALWGRFYNLQDYPSYNPDTMFFAHYPHTPPRYLASLRALDGISDTTALAPTGPGGDDLGPLTLVSLLQAARAADADLVLVYTASTDADAADVTLSVGTLLTLGLGPTILVSGEATLEAVLIDAHTGYVFAISEVSGSSRGLASDFGLQDGKRAEASEAVDAAVGLLIDQLTDAWPAMRAAYP